MDRELSIAEALGADRVTKLDEISARVDRLHSLIEGVMHLEVEPIPITAAKVDKLGITHPDEHWHCIALGGGEAGKWVCMPVPERARNRAEAAILLSPLHMQLVTWWLNHAWRFVELTSTCLAVVDGWNLHVSAILTRAVIEEVGCLLYEARKIQEAWSATKQDSYFGAGNVSKSLYPLLLQFRIGGRGLEESGFPTLPATNVMTYVDKLAKQGDLADLRGQYDLLSNAAHPALTSRFTYHSPPVTFGNGSAAVWRIHRRPTSVAGQTEDLDYLVAHSAVDALLAVAPVGIDVLWQSLRIVDDFGLTVKAHGLTAETYWRKIRHRSVEVNCPCGCGEWRKNQHKWGQPAPEINLRSTSGSSTG